MEQHKFCISVITNKDGKLMVTEQYHLSDEQIEGYYSLFIKRLLNREIQGVTMELSKEVETVN